MPSVRLSALVFVVGVLGGCDLLLAFRSLPVDASATDAGPGSDGGPVDIQPLPDGSQWPSDGALADGGLASDGGTPSDGDVLNDGGLTDTSAVDAQPGAPPCNDVLATVLQQVSPVMAICDGGRWRVDQCNAQSLCNESGGWRLCPASVYRAQFDGKGDAPSKANAWISGCIRSGAAPYSPVDGLCSCVAGLTTEVPIGWDCGTSETRVSGGGRHAGLVSWRVCQVVGEPLPTNTGHWTPHGATSVTTSAVCCTTAP